MGHCFDASQFDQVGDRQRMRGLSRSDFADDLQGLVWALTGQEGIGQPEAGFEVVRFQLNSALELQSRLSVQALGREGLPEAESNARIINRSVDSEQRVPIPVPADFFLDRFAGWHGLGGSGVKGVVEGQIDFGRNVFRVQPSSQCKSLSGIVHAAQPLQLDAPPIERARIPAPDHARVVYFPGDQGGQPIQGGTGVVPERLVFLYGGVGQRRGRDRIGGIRGEVVNQSVGLQVKGLEIVAKTGMQIIDFIAASQRAHLIHQVERVNGRHRCIRGGQRRPAIGEAGVQ